MSDLQTLPEVSVVAESNAGLRADAARPAAVRPAYSMTGYASAQSATGDGLAFTLAMKSVNHRFLDLNLRLPSDCDALEVGLRRMVKERVRRGHVDVDSARGPARRASPAQTVQLNRELLAAHLHAFQEAAKLHHFNVEPDLNELLRMPGVLSTEAGAALLDPARVAALEAAVMALAPSLLEQLNQVRAVEGAALAAELRAAMLRLRILAEECAQLRSGAREAHFERLRTRIAELLRAGCGELPTRLRWEAQPQATSVCWPRPRCWWSGRTSRRSWCGCARTSRASSRCWTLAASWASGWTFCCRS